MWYRFFQMLRRDLNENVEGWENPTLESFLEAMATWLYDTETIPDTPTWGTLAIYLLADKV
ncbi:DUF7660 family protein [Paenibacillus hodogayensis]|uniref:DUF7660 family protein n=1 Tax=Paenibacillus hodogayensis TaxID=279208 RepID=UPI003CD0784C